MKKARHAPSRQRTTTSSTQQKADELTEAWFSLTIDSQRMIKEQLVRKNKAESVESVDWKAVDVDWKKVDDNNTLYISKCFDCLEWWLNVGSSSTSRYRDIYPLFTIVSALPAANGFQERTFSICTVFDHHLRQNMKPCRFEMSVLLAVNDGLMTKGVASEEEAKAIVLKVLERYNTTPDAAKQLGIDPDAADFTAEDEDD